MKNIVYNGDTQTCSERQSERVSKDISLIACLEEIDQ